METIYNTQRKDASVFTRQANHAVAQQLGLDIQNGSNEEYELARDNCIRAAEALEIRNEAGKVVWSVKAFDFLKRKEIPDTVNPSLWVHGRADRQAGLFSVLPGKIYQVRGFDLSNLTLVRSQTGWIILDVMTNVETSRAALQFAEETLQEEIRGRIRAVIISHSHSDHFGGIRGVLEENQVGRLEDGKVPIYVPAGFQEAAVKENIYAGAAMRRRAEYQFGNCYDCGEKATVDSGLGFSAALGTISFLPPTYAVAKNQTVNIDGLTVDFQLTPGTEAPAEMNNYFREYRALWLAENCCGTLHNLYPIRGAQLRDAEGWAHYILQALQLYGDKTDVVFQSHHWPHFNTAAQPDAIRNYLLNNAAVYQYIHDQTLLYANEGLTEREIAHRIQVPQALLKNWYVRPYYGSVEINARAVYNKYLGFYNANPIQLFPLPEVEAARKFVEYVGSEETVLQKAQADFERGEYQWAAFASNQVVFANPQNQSARRLCADALEQLGYQAETSIWRNAYLQGAKELREGAGPVRRQTLLNTDMVRHMTSAMLLEMLGIVVDGEKAAEQDLLFDMIVLETDQTQSVFEVRLYRGALLAYPKDSSKPAGKAHIRLNRADFVALLLKQPLSAAAESVPAELLPNLQNLVIDLRPYSRFSIIEP